MFIFSIFHFWRINERVAATKAAIKLPKAMLLRGLNKQNINCRFLQDAQRTAAKSKPFQWALQTQSS